MRVRSKERGRGTLLDGRELVKAIVDWKAKSSESEAMRCRAGGWVP